MADECREYLRQVFESHKNILQLLFPVLKFGPENSEFPVDIFFLDVIPVPPPIVRPANKFKSEIREHPQTTVLKNIIDANIVLNAIVANMNTNTDENVINESTVRT